jgi:WD40 repeat protein
VVTLKLDHNLICISLSTDNKTIATGVDDGRGSVHLWDATTGHIIHTLENPRRSAIDSISTPFDTSFLVALRYDVMGINTNLKWITARWKQQLDGRWMIDVRREYLLEKNLRPHFTSCSSSGPRFAFSNDRRIVIRGLHGNETQVEEGGGAVIFSPDGDWLVGIAEYETGGRALKIWDAASGKMLSELLSVRDTQMIVFLSHDGSTILAGDDGILRVLVLTDR